MNMMNMRMNMKNLPSAKTVLSTAASAAATVVLVRSVAGDLLPYEVQHLFRQKISFLFASISPQITVTIDESEGLHENQLFQATDLYLGAITSPSTRRFRAAIPAKETKVVFSIDNNQDLVDVFNGVPLRWTKVVKQTSPMPISYDEERNMSYKTQVSHFELSFHKKHRDMVFESYFPHILAEALELKQRNKTLKIHTLRIGRMYTPPGQQWLSINLDHPSTFDTLAMDLNLKKTIMEDLELFLTRKDFYKKVGKAWKRGYLLFGPPGTGKSSLIAAMANYLNFDIYDLELTALTSNSELRKLIMGTANRSILVVEDIDCSIDLERMKAAQPPPNNSMVEVHPTKKITLSGLLNFIDGLWSSCGDERIIIFTTNHKERLDPALLRPGRMDVHIHMSYCTPCGFKMLVSNYLGITAHPLFAAIEEVVTPAEVGEQLLKTEDPEDALRWLLKFLKAKKSDQGNVIVEEAKEDGGMTKKIMRNGG